MGKIGKYFTLQELTVTGSGANNTPGSSELDNLRKLVDNILDPARELLDDQIYINSGYRSPIVNRKIGGASSSQHVLGQAADIRCDDNAKLFELIRKQLPFDQLIWEDGDDNQPKWVHVSYGPRNRRQVLRMKKKVNGKATYTELSDK